MPTIPDSYASPLLRWALLLEDHPTATYTFELRPGLDVGVPADFGGEDPHCVCTVFIPGHEPVVGYKTTRGEKQDSDGWNLLCSKTLGRALKRAGYPDDLAEMKALVLWRQRNAEVAMIGTGPPAAGLTAGERVQRALDAAAVPTPEPDVDRDDPPPGPEVSATRSLADDVPDDPADRARLAAELGHAAGVTPGEVDELVSLITGEELDLASCAPVTVSHVAGILREMAHDTLEIGYHEGRMSCLVHPDGTEATVEFRSDGTIRVIPAEQGAAPIDIQMATQVAGVRVADVIREAGRLAKAAGVPAPRNLAEASTSPVAEQLLAFLRRENVA